MEVNFKNAARRLTGLSMLKTLIDFVKLQGNFEVYQKYIDMAMSGLCSSLHGDSLFHYLDGVRGCGNFMEIQLRETFFALISTVM